MNIQQYKYVLGLAKYRHFEEAANNCFISQSTLSTMISRFENEIGVLIFDRKKKPVQITQEGELIINQLKHIIKEIDSLNELTHEIKGEVKGKLNISVIPTIAPFLLPLFLQDFALKFKDLDIEVKEQTTAEIMRQLKNRDIDIGIVSVPIDDSEIEEIELYNEPFLFFDMAHRNREMVKPKDLKSNSLYLLEEGHCMRTQIVQLCDMYKLSTKSKLNFDYKAGSIDSLLRFVKANGATTLLPYLSTLNFAANEKECLARFVDPVPYRTVGLVVHRHFVKKKILEALKAEILKNVVGLLPDNPLGGKVLSPV